MLPYEVEKRWPGETTGGRRTGPAVSDRHPALFYLALHSLLEVLELVLHPAVLHLVSLHELQFDGRELFVAQA